MAVKLSNCSLMEMLAVIPKVHFKKSQNFRIKGSWMEGFIHIEPRRLGGNTRTFAGVPALNLAPLPPQSPSFFQPWWNRTEQGSCDKLSAQLGDGAMLMRGMVWNGLIPQGPRGQPAPADSSGGGTMLRFEQQAYPQSCENNNTRLFPRGGRRQQFFGFCEPLCFPNVWGLALQYIHA